MRGFGCPRRMATFWTCPRCHRRFRRASQRHACGVGSRSRLLRGKAPHLEALYRALESTLRSFGKHEIVTRERYALFRTTRIFADLVFMRDALRLVIHLGREAHAPCFFKVQRESPNRVGHVALLRSEADVRMITRYLEEAYLFAMSEETDIKPRRRPSGAGRRSRS